MLITDFSVLCGILDFSRNSNAKRILILYGFNVLAFKQSKNIGSPKKGEWCVEGRVIEEMSGSLQYNRPKYRSFSTFASSGQTNSFGQKTNQQIQSF